MGFIESYKRLEKLCGDLLNDDRRVSAYIDEMMRVPSGSFYVATWEEDLKKLKHYRWIRNKIVHEPDCGESDLCEPGDAAWLDQFYARILAQTDPLALFRKAHGVSAPKQVQKPVQTPSKMADVRPSGRAAGCATIGCLLLASTLAVFAALVFLF